MAASRSKTYKTRSLVLATYLRHHGYVATIAHDGTHPRSGRPIGAWIFDSTPSLDDLVNAYNNKQAQVEPQSFYRLAKETRGAMLDMLNEHTDAPASH